MFFIGANNMCDCYDGNSTIENFERLLDTVISTIYRQIPKVFVYLVPIFETGFIDVFENGRDSLYCLLMWNILRCECLINSTETREISHKLAIEYNKSMYKVAENYNRLNKTDFYVSIATMLQNFKIPDRSFTSKFDCFHPSLKANSLISVAAWNNMQLPLERKPRNIVFPLEPVCPTETTYLQ